MHRLRQYILRLACHDESSILSLKSKHGSSQNFHKTQASERMFILTEFLKCEIFQLVSLIMIFESKAFSFPEGPSSASFDDNYLCHFL